MVNLEVIVVRFSLLRCGSHLLSGMSFGLVKEIPLYTDISKKNSLFYLSSFLSSWEPTTSKRPYVSILANTVFKLAVRFKLVQSWDEQSTGSYAMLPGPGGSRAEAERRRLVVKNHLHDIISFSSN